MSEEPWIANFQTLSENGRTSWAFFNEWLSRKTIRVYRVTLQSTDNSPSFTNEELKILSGRPDITNGENASGAFRKFVPLAENKPLDPYTHLYPATFDSADPAIGATLRSFLFDSSGAAYNVRDLKGVFCEIPFNILWDIGYEDANVQPLTFAGGESRGIIMTGIGTANKDVEILFTSDDS